MDFSFIRSYWEKSILSIIDVREFSTKTRCFLYMAIISFMHCLDSDIVLESLQPLVYISSKEVFNYSTKKQKFRCKNKINSKLLSTKTRFQTINTIFYEHIHTSTFIPAGKDLVYHGSILVNNQYQVHLQLLESLWSIQIPQSF